MEQKINVHWSWYTRIVTILGSLVLVSIVWRELRNFLADFHDYGACCMCWLVSFFWEYL